MTMADRLALVLVGSSSPTEGSLQLESGETIEVGSSAWFRWLEENPSFRFESGFAGSDSFTARKHERDSGEFWYAYRKLDKVVRSLYLGKSRRLDVERMLEAANKLSQPPQSKAEGYAQKCITLPNVEGTDVALAQQSPTVSELQALLHKVSHLEAQLEAARSQLDAMTARAMAREQQLREIPDFDALRTRVLGNLKLGKQAPEYKRIKAALDKFIALLQQSPGS